MYQGHILIIDEHFESDQQIVFLLKLAGFKITLARNCVEGINWLTSLHQESSRFDLMLIRNVTQMTDLLTLCEISNRLAGGLDVLLVENHHSVAVIADICASSGGRTGSCRQEMITQRVRHLFD